MKIFNLVSKIIIMLTFISLICVFFSIAITPKDKALTSYTPQNQVIVELSEDYYLHLVDEGLNLNIDGNIKTVRLDELGVSIYSNSSALEKFLSKIFNRETYYEITLDLQKVYKIVESLNSEYKTNPLAKIEIKQNRWEINPIEKEKYIEYEKTVDSIFESIRNQKLDINIQTNLKTPDIYIPSQDLLDSLRQNMTQPIYFEINDFGEIKKYQLIENEIYELLKPSIIHNSLDISINESLLNTKINDKLKNIPRNQEIKIKRTKVIGKDTTLDVGNISKEAYKIIKNRINHSDQSDQIISHTKYAPFTNGDKFERYIEVDLSQKMLYAWENGKLKYEMLVSTGFNNTTPKGEYQIQNKADNPFSDIDNSYMPFWMSFHKDKRFDAWLGFHALTHKINSKGKYIYEPETNLGGTTSGGCVKLGRKEAEILYNWAVVGDKVIIHD